MLELPKERKMDAMLSRYGGNVVEKSPIELPKAQVSDEGSLTGARKAGGEVEPDDYRGIGAPVGWWGGSSSLIKVCRVHSGQVSEKTVCVHEIVL
jgi:hypothetical protein